MLERHKAFLRFFPCRAEKFPAIRYTPRACPGPGWGKRPIPSYPCGGYTPSGLRPTGPACGGAALRADLVALRAVSIPRGGNHPSGFAYGAAAGRRRIIMCLRRSRPLGDKSGPTGRLGPEGAVMPRSGSSPPAGGDSLSANRAQGAGTAHPSKRLLFLSHGTTSRAYYPTYQGWRSWIRPSLRFPLHRARYLAAPWVPPPATGAFGRVPQSALWLLSGAVGK